ncbi:MAG: hypothetical protein WCE58_04000 [Gallionella sp.]
MREIPSPPSWFAIERYEPARRFGFREWATQIGNRFLLGAQLTHGKLDEFDQSFTRIAANPFDDLGYRGSYPSDKTVFPLSFGVARAVTNILSDAGCGDDEFCDEKLREIDPDLYGAQSILFVNLKAPRTLLKEQFDAWLETSLLERKRAPAITAPVTQTWAINHPILPYQDLKLWHKRHGRELPKDSVMANWLDLDFANRDIIRQIREKAAWIFTDDVYFDLIFSASNASPPTS